MSYDPIDDAMMRKFESERAALCRKYSEQFWEEQNAGRLPNLALIINDAVNDGIIQYAKLRSAEVSP